MLLSHAGEVRPQEEGEQASFSGKGTVTHWPWQFHHVGEWGVSSISEMFSRRGQERQSGEGWEIRGRDRLGGGANAGPTPWTLKGSMGKSEKGQNRTANTSI